MASRITERTKAAPNRTAFFGEWIGYAWGLFRTQTGESGLDLPPFNNLPRQLTSLIGREREMGQLLELVWMKFIKEAL